MSGPTSTTAPAMDEGARALLDSINGFGRKLQKYRGSGGHLSAGEVGNWLEQIATMRALTCTIGEEQARSRELLAEAQTQLEHRLRGGLMQ